MLSVPLYRVRRHAVLVACLIVVLVGFFGVQAARHRWPWGPTSEEATYRQLESEIRRMPVEPTRHRLYEQHREKACDSGRIREAITFYESLAGSNPEAPEAYIQLGLAYIDFFRSPQNTRGELTWVFQAEKAFKKAVELDPSCWHARYALARYYFKSPPIFKRMPTAISEFEAALSLQRAHGEPDLMDLYPKAFVYLGDAYLSEKDEAHAVAIWREGLAAYPEDPDLLARIEEHLLRE